MKDSIKFIGLGVFFAITVLGFGILFNAGLPIFDPGISENNLSTLLIERKSTLPSPSEPYLNLSESQITHCMILKTACQALIDDDQDLIEISINRSELNCIISHLESLSSEGTDISWIYYQGFFFGLSFATG